MKHSLKINSGKWLVIGGLLVLMIITSIGNVLAVDLSGAEKASLTLMREEEKLARDVYQYLYDLWGTPIFNNIATSEQTHMNAIKTLLIRYDIEDPVVAGEPPGEFVNEELQDLYYVLILKGISTLEDALNVGVIIENKDIVDLEDGIDSTKRKDIKTVYSNLLKGSLNHLEAFNSNLAKQQ